MVQHKTHEIASYLRNGSLWVGRFVVSSGDLYFGDDRFDATHGLASVVCAEPARSANEADPRMRAWGCATDPTDVRKTSNVPASDAVVERLKRAA